MRLTQKGMTLIEMLLAGVISVIIGGVILVIYLMYNTQTRQTNAFFDMQMQYENVSEEIAKQTRRAHRLLNCSAPAYYDTCNDAAETVSSTFFYDTSAAGRVIAGFRINGDRLQEYILDGDGAGWIDFRAGRGVVQVDPTRSNFILNGCRNGIAIHLTLQYPTNDTTFYLEPRKDEFVCRN